MLYHMNIFNIRRYIKVIKFLPLIFLLAIRGFSEGEPPLSDSVVYISVTSQQYDYYSPWEKGPVRQVNVCGAVLEGGRIVTASAHLADHQLIEVQKHGGMKKFPARVLAKDYRTGLALLTVDDREFFTTLKPVKLVLSHKIVGEEAVAARWDSQGNFKEYSAKCFSTVMERQSPEIYDANSLALVHHMTTGMDTGGYGEPVFIKGELAGITLRVNDKTNSLQVCSSLMIKKMHDDISDGKYEGLPFFSILYAPVESDVNLREFLGLTDGLEGMYVMEISPLSSGSGIIKSGDVILGIDGEDLNDRGLIKSGRYVNLDFRAILFLNHSVGSTITMKVIRNRKPLEISFRLLPFPDNDFTVPQISSDTQPFYIIFGGLLFQELSRGYMRPWASDTGSPGITRLHIFIQKSLASDQSGTRRIVILNRVMPSSANSGYEDKKNLILKAVNGKKVSGISDLKKLITGSREEFIKFDFTGGSSIVIKRVDAIKSGPDILRKYNIDVQSYP